jgi:type III pantothenate kinase
MNYIFNRFKSSLKDFVKNKIILYQMNLIIDLGNTFIKFFLYDKGNLYDSEILDYPKKMDSLAAMFFSLFKNKNVINVIISSVMASNPDFENQMKGFFKNVIILDNSTNLPVKNLYKTPQTLGYDRVAGVVAANFLYPETNILVIDAGTAITYDIINSYAEYLGGNISPGLEMRFKALNFFTQKLPLLSKKEIERFFGDNTNDAVILGVQNGLLYEIQGYIDAFINEYKNSKIIFTGGDTFFFEKKVKRTIFALPNLISIGLNRILEYNV